MKVQKLGLVLGMNMAAACLVLQGCKATRPGTDNLPPPVVDPGPATRIETIPATPSEPSVTVTPEVKPLPPPAVATPPAKVAEVKPLPPPPAPKKHPKAVAPVAGGSTVVVQRGDTLSGICVRHRVKMSAVVAANPGLNPNHIRVGQKIVLPGAAVAAVAEKPAAKVKLAAADAPVTAANTTAPVKTKSAFKAYTGPTKTYKVRSGDSLGKIAYESGITIRALKDLNKLTKDSIRVGQELLIPAEKVVAKPAAKAPDAKKAAAKKDAKELKKEGAEKKEAAAPVAETTSLSNAVETAAAVPPAEVAPAPAAAESATPDSAPASSSATYTAKEGDDIVSIAIAYGISPSRLMDLNDLKAGDSIKAGQVLKLPADAKPSAQ